jgi:hypothetical protein
MKTTLAHRFVLSIAICLANAAFVQADFVGAGSASATAPTVDGADIANLGLGVGFDDPAYATEPWLIRDIWNGNPVQGQTFTTGDYAAGYELRAVTLRNMDYWGADGPNGVAGGMPGTLSIQFGTLTGNTLTPVATVTSSNLTSFNRNDYITVTFAAPITLAANTTYGFDWDSSAPGFNTANTMANEFAGGQAYRSGSGGDGPVNNDLVFLGNQDRIFHLDMTPVPEPGTVTLLVAAAVGLLAYAWRTRK